jgi:hypothetical protein
MYEATIARIKSNEATNQEIFDCVWEWFVTLKNPRSMKNGSSLSGMECAYRGDDGARCAGGLFIPDDQYSESMEMISFSYLATYKLPGYRKYADFIGSLQSCHDKAARSAEDVDGEGEEPAQFFVEIKSLLREAASQHNITVKGE